VGGGGAPGQEGRGGAAWGLRGGQAASHHAVCDRRGTVASSLSESPGRNALACTLPVPIPPGPRFRRPPAPYTPPPREHYNKAVSKGRAPGPLPEELQAWEERAGGDVMDLAEVILK
jgi:hypothetical protein